MPNTTGSVWRHWDLHVHSPISVLENRFKGSTVEKKWKRYFDRLESLDDIAVLGVTDYFSIEGYERVREAREEGRLSNISLVVPNVELRITPVTGSEGEMNIHVIASPAIADRLEAMLLSNLTFDYAGNSYQCTREELKRLGYAFDGNTTPRLNDAGAYKIGVNQFNVGYKDVRNLYREHRDLREHSIIVVPNGKDGNSGIRQDNMQATRIAIYRMSHAIFSGNPADREYFLGRTADTPEDIVKKYDGLMPCIHGSDAHELEEIGQPDQDRRTWIKADTTFEGLKQICYEPEHRVRIAERKPPVPVRRIERVEIDFPDDTQIEAQGHEEKFCLRGKHTVSFSPGLTCLVGGRGTGKSTLLNLIRQGLGEKTEFFKQNSLSAASTSSGSGRKPVDFTKHVTVKTKGEADALEFLSQNEIEAFAVDHERFTDAIYRRLKGRDTEDEIDRAAHALSGDLEAMDELGDLIEEERALVESLDDLKKKLKAREDLISSLEEEEYQSLTASSEELSRKRTALRRSRNRLNKLVSHVETGLEKEAPVEPIAEGEAEESAEEYANVFETRRAVLIQALRRAVETARDGIALSEASDREKDLESKITEVEGELKRYLEERDISEENVQDISKASEERAELSDEVEEHDRLLDQNQAAQGRIEISEDSRETFEKTIRNHVEQLNERLQQEAEEVQHISLHYRFAHERAMQDLTEHLCKELAGLNSGRRPSATHVQSILEEVIADNELPSETDLLETLTSVEGTEKTVKLFQEYFRDKFNYRAFRLRIRRTFSDIAKYKRIQVLYKEKPLTSASFGQRCTAAIIVLIMLGNAPIIIDEPEAHLDSALIAHLLVDLVKQQKTNRQIIFATHNANFVVNGDAELIHVLQTVEGNKTEITPTTLENLDLRDKILALEGGEKAFQQREERYGMKVLHA